MKKPVPMQAPHPGTVPFSPRHPDAPVRQPNFTPPQRPK